jgi:hypothetical protein
VNFSFHNEIEQRLKKYGFDCLITRPYVSLKQLKASDKMAVFYHNSPYCEIIECITYNDDFIFEGQNLLLTNISDLLWLPNRSRRNKMPKSDLLFLNKWVSKICSNQIVRLLEYQKTAHDYEYYLQIEDRAARLLIYLVLIQEK